MLYNALSKGPYKVEGVHDKDRRRLFGVIFKPYEYQNDTVYHRYDENNYDIVVPTTFKGFYFKVKNPGKSHLSIEPTWVNTLGEETTQDGTDIIWEACYYNLLPLDQNITAVSYTMSDGVTLTGESYNDYSCQFFIEPLPIAAVTAGKFTINVHFTSSNGEEDDITLLFTVAER
jgi:hypothetical protein